MAGPRRRWRTLMAGLLLGLVAAGLPAQAGADTDDPRLADRLYLLESADDMLAWSVDPTDPELGTHPIRRLCGYWLQQATRRRDPCLGGYGHVFPPASLIDVPPTWRVDEPLRFHLELDVASPDDVRVTLEVQDEEHISEPGEATEVSPGVWEGEIPTYDGVLTGRETVFVLRATPRNLAGTGVHVDLTLGGRGRSWVELPEPVPARSVPDLLAADTYRPSPSSFAAAGWELAFNDDAWASHSFAGDVTETRSFPVPVDEHATAVVGWVRVFEAPPVHRLVQGTPPDRRQVTDGVSVDLRRDGSRVEGLQLTGGTPAGASYASFAAPDLDPGTVMLEVAPTSTSEDAAYEAHVVVLYGERTLRQLRARVLGDTSARTPSVAVCRGGGVIFPVSRAVTTYALDLDWDSYALPDPQWTPAYDTPSGAMVCGGGGNGDRVRLTFRQHGITGASAHPTVDSDYVSLYDTVFDWQIDFTHSAPVPT